MSVTRHSLAVEDGHLPSTIARAGGAGAALVIVPSAFGVGPDLEEQMDELAADARVVVALDPFFREDGGVAPYDDMARVLGRLERLDRERAQRDLRATIAWTRAQPEVTSVVVLGICFGGPHALRAAADGGADGVVTWHGTRMEAHLARASEMRCPMRLCFGSIDPFVPPAAIEAIRVAFAHRNDVRISVHEGATHGFSHRGAARAYDARAERAAMRAARELIARRE